MPTWIVENEWTCPSCGTVNKGRRKDCSACGAPKEDSVQDRLPADYSQAAAITDSERLMAAQAGPDWTCLHCDGKNPVTEAACVNCGASRTIPPPPIPDGPRSERVTEGILDRVRPVPPSSGGPGRERTGPPWWALPAIMTACALAAIFAVWLFGPREVAAKVVTRYWRYEADLRQRTLAHDEGWGLPAGSFNSACETRVRGYRDCNPRRCNPHQVSYSCRPHSCNCTTSPVRCRDNGNGTSTCSGGDRSCSTCYDTCYRTEYDTCYDKCPVHDQWCRYDRWVWPVVKQGETGGRTDEVRWPDLAAVGDEQRLDRRESYAVTFAADGEQWSIKPAGLEEFRRYQAGARWRLRVNRAGSVEPLGVVAAEAE